MKVRETWYYPESAYWVTFDNSIPMFLLPYLSARLSDIDTCVKYKVPGHITFSSGWEWGYWLFDWSIARWSWQYTTDGVAQKRYPEMYAHEMLKEQSEKDFFSQSLHLQQQYLKDSSLIKWLTAMTIIDEMPIKAFNHEFQPRPKWSYKFLQRKADTATIERVRREAIAPLIRFAGSTRRAMNVYDTFPSHITDSILQEFQDGIQITALRANHRASVLQYILCRREAKIKHSKCDCDMFLNNAAFARDGAQKTVAHRENLYRYPVELIARKRWDHTSYHTGYLYTVSNLYFWKRKKKKPEEINTALSLWASGTCGVLRALL